MTRQQEWARKALEHVQKARDKGETYAKKYKTAAMKGASLVQRVGALQAVAFWMSRSDGAFRDFADHVAATWRPGQRADALRESLMKIPTDEYLIASRDLTEVALWFRRMAQAEMRDVTDDANP